MIIKKVVFLFVLTAAAFAAAVSAQTYDNKYAKKFVLGDNSSPVISLTLRPASTITSAYSLTFPAAVGSSGQILVTTDGVGTLGWANQPTGTVSSVALSLPATVFSVSGSPVTTSGTLSASYVNQSANLFFAGPSSGAAATPAFRSLATADLSSIAVLYNTTSTQNTATIGASNYLFDLAYGATVALQNALGARISVTNTATSGSNRNATGLTINATATSTGTATGLAVTAAGGSTQYSATFSGGNVGIINTGSSTPAALLDVAQTSTSATTTALKVDHEGTGSAAPALEIPRGSVSFSVTALTLTNANVNLDPAYSVFEITSSTTNNLQVALPTASNVPAGTMITVINIPASTKTIVITGTAANFNLAGSGANGHAATLVRGATANWYVVSIN